jgi:hypothetical protein
MGASPRLDGRLEGGKGRWTRGGGALLQAEEKNQRWKEELTGGAQLAAREKSAEEEVGCRGVGGPEEEVGCGERAGWWAKREKGREGDEVLFFFKIFSKLLFQTFEIELFSKHFKIFKTF